MRPVPADFDLAIASSVSGYVTHAVTESVGEAPGSFVLPHSTDEIRATVDDLANAALTATGTRSARLALETLGRGLFEAVFNGEVYAALRRSLDKAAEDDRVLRIRLRLSEAPELIDLPWEVIYFPARGAYMAADRATPIVRYLDLAEGAQPLAVDLPLRILAVAASPEDLPELNVKTEREKLQRALAPLIEANAVHVTWADDGTLGGLSRAIEDGRPHVLHFIGHGEWDGTEDSGVLAFEAGPKDRHWTGVRADTLAAAFRGSESLRLVVLNACEGARTGRRDTFAGVAQALVRAGMPAIVAMQFPITDDAAIHFSEALYGAIGTGDGVDAAVASARHAMLLQQDDVEWATPVLYLRARDARLFDLGAAIQPAPAVAPPVATISTGQVDATNGSPDGVRLDREDHAAATLRPRPIRLLPADFPGLIGRDSDVAAVQDALAGGSFAVYGDRGIGKSSLIRNLTNRLDDATDVVHLHGRRRPTADLGQALFEAFYAETQPPQRPSEPQLHHYLSQVTGVVAIDDIGGDRDDVEALLDTAPGCRFLVAAETQPLSGPGQSRHLSGLEPADGVALVVADLGRALSPVEAKAAETIVQAVAGSPGRILKSIAPVREGTSSLEQLGAASGAAPGATRDAANRITRLLGSVKGASVGIEHIEALAGVTANDIATLEARGLIQAQSPRYALTTPSAIGGGGPTDAVVYELLPHLARWAESHRDRPSEIVDEADVILAALELGAEHERWGEVTRLGRAVEDAFFVSRRWGQWRVVLDRLEAAAGGTGDTSGTARVHHQIGSLVGALGNIDAGKGYLQSAFDVRQGGGDTSGAALSKHNIGVLDALIPPGGGGSTGVHIPFLPIILAIVAVLAVGGIAAVAGVLPPRPTPAPAAKLGVEPARLEFGEVQLGMSSDPRSIVVRNTGTGVATLAPPTVDPGIADFDVDSNCKGQLQIDESCEIRVSFAPAAAGPRQADLVIASDAAGAAARVRLAGTGRPPPGAPAIELGRDTLDFGEVQIGRSASQTVQITSRGETPLRITAITDSGLPFRTDPGDCLERDIAHGQTCTFTESFTPTDAAPYVGTLTIESNTGGTPQTIPLSGGGTGTAHLAVDPASVDFGAHRRDEKPTSAFVTVTNDGNLPTKIGDVSIPDSLPNPDGGAVFGLGASECGGLTLDVKASCRIEVIFNPGLAGPDSAKATLTIPYETGAALTVPLTGSALVLPDLVGDAAAQDYKWTHGAIAVPFSALVTNRGESQAGRFAVRAWITPKGGEPAPIALDEVFDGAELQNGYALTTRELKPGDSLKFGATVTIPIDDIYVDHEFRLEVRIDDCVARTDEPPACRIPESDETNNSVLAGDIKVPANVVGLVREEGTASALRERAADVRGG